jgi:hypothetical protein
MEKNRTRFLNTMNFSPVDRLPIVEWAGWWDKTIDRWKGEGLPKDLENAGEIRAYLGLDTMRQWWIGLKKPTFPATEAHGKEVVSDMESYLRVKEHLYPEEVFDRETVEQWAVEQKHGDMVVWISLEGFFWFPRT